MTLTAADVATLRRDLDVDHVLSFAQVRRRHGLRVTPDEVRAAGLAHTQRVVRTVHGSTAQVHLIDFVVESRWQTRDTWMLGHLAGVAEVRTQLQVPSEAWTSDAGRLDGARPDATFSIAGGGVVAVEYDTGSYRDRTVRDKLRTFSGSYAGLVYAVSGRRRVTYVRNRLWSAIPDAGARARVTVLHVPWWV